MQAVTASELVRHFGAWRDRAMNTPVYIHHHGRPKLVLTSVDFIEDLVSAAAVEAPADGGVPALLDMIDAIVLVADANLALVGVSPPARHLLGRSDWRGCTLEEVLPDSVRPFLMRAVETVRAGGVSERLQLRLGARGDRRVDLMVQPYDGGVCIFGRDRTAQEVQATAEARSRSIDDLLALLGTVAWLRINLRGYVVEASGSFEAMTGLGIEACRSVRLPSLFDRDTRAAVGDALEATIDTLSASVVSARLVTNDARTLEVRLAMSAEQLRMSGDTILAIVTTAPSPDATSG